MFSLSFNCTRHHSPPTYHDEQDASLTMKCEALKQKAGPTGRAIGIQDGYRARPSPQPMSPTTTRPVSIPSRNSSRSSTSRKASSSNRTSRDYRECANATGAHRRDAVPASVAALLAMTSIPPRRTSSMKKRLEAQHRISIDELVREWRSEALNMPSYGSHKSMDVLLDSAAADVLNDESTGSEVYPSGLLSSRSNSSASVPSLDPDEASLLSLGSPLTPDVTRSSRADSISTSARKSKRRSHTPAEDCALDHPLIPRSVPDADDDLDVSSPLSIPSIKNFDRRKSSFKSNLTLSLQSLKSRALSSLSQLSLNNAGPQLSNTPYAYSDATLWEHPYIFPRLSPEVRPVSFSGVPTKSERRYFNPSVISFDEQQSRYRQALHNSSSDPFSALVLEEHRHSPMIQMKTYTRNPAPKRTKAKSTGPDPNSEAGRALAGPPLVRQREPRENSDFLRVVVLEMNMRRVGKLEETVGGRARIWLPPRQNAPADGGDAMVEVAADSTADGKRGTTTTTRSVPRRWTGVVVYDG